VEDRLWNDHVTHHFLLGSHSCAIDSLAGYGNAYLERLSDLECLPRTIIVPDFRSRSLTDNLLRDERALRSLASVVENHRLDIATFHSYSRLGYDQLLRKVTAEHVPRLHPSVKAFETANDKIRARELFSRAGIPVPEGAVCTSPREVRDFHRHCLRSGSGMLVKKLHFESYSVAAEEDPGALPGDLTFPVLAERIHAVEASLATSTICWEGEVEHLFTVEQVLRGWGNYGSSLPVGVSPEVAMKVAQYCVALPLMLPGYTGVLNVDFIVGPDGVMAVDLNPRFGSSTFPFFFLRRMGIRHEEVSARYRYVKATMPSMSAIAMEDGFIPFSSHAREGVVLIGPTFDFDLGVVTGFYYLAVAQDQARRARIERSLAHAIQRASSRGAYSDTSISDFPTSTGRSRR